MITPEWRSYEQLLDYIDCVTKVKQQSPAVLLLGIPGLLRDYLFIPAKYSLILCISFTQILLLYTGSLVDYHTY